MKVSDSSYATSPSRKTLAVVLDNDTATRLINFDNIRTYSTDFPKTWSFLWSPEEASEITKEHKDQIFFLNDEASKFVGNYIDSSKMITGRQLPVA